MVLMFSGSVSAASLNTTPLPNYSNIYVNISNTEGVSFNTTGNGTYYIQSLSSPNGGFNAVHIANDSSTALNYGGSINTTQQSGTFYATDTGGRGYQDDVVLLLAVNGTIPTNFKVQITAEGYSWIPSGVMNQPPSVGDVTYGVTLNETFTQSEFLYGLQDWKPTGGNANYPIFIGENMSDPNNMFYLMFIDTHAGLLGSNYPGGNSQFINNGALEINYTFTNLQSTAAFNIYAWNWNTTQGQGMLWTNSILPGNTGGPSGITVTGSSLPSAAFTATPFSGLAPLTVQFTDSSSGASPLTYLWNFGDNITSTLENPSHKYNNAGTYNATLTVTNTYGSSQITNVINVVNLLVSASVLSGLYNTNQTVNLTSTNPRAVIYYTLNGSNPTKNSTPYTAPINITNEGTTILNFIGIDGNLNSLIGTENYTLNEIPPTIAISPSGGTYNITQNVTLTTIDNSSTTTYYTTDNSNPMLSNTRTVYSTPIPIHSTTTLKYAALDAAGNWSPVYTANYTMISVTPPVVSADLPSGTYTTIQNVDLSATDELDSDPLIFYTENGSNPTINSTFYDYPISIGNSGTTILKFIAVNYAGLVSNIVTNTYILNKPAVSGTWTTTQIDNNTEYSSIAIDANGYPHIAYYQNSISGNNPELKYAYEDKNGWHIQTVESTPSGSGYYVSLALDSSGNPHLVYEDIFGDGNPYTLRYAYYNGTTWQFTNLTTSYPGNPTGDNIIYCNLVLYQNQPRISFYNETSKDIDYMYYNGTNWISEIAAQNGGYYNSLAVDSSGTPEISFYSISPDSGIGSLRFTKLTSQGTWQMQIVDNSADNTGEWNSLAIDSNGNPHISYIYGDGSLRYASWDGTAWEIDGNVSSTNSSSNLVSSALSTDCRLILNQSNTPLITYENVISTDLEYAYYEGGTWANMAINTINGTNGQISMALNSLGTSYISYETATTNLGYGYLIPFNASANPVGGTYTSNQTVTLTSTPGTSIYYTLDGSNPTNSTTRIAYSSPILIKNSATLEFVAIDSADNHSNVYFDTYVILTPVTNNRTGKNYSTIQSAINDSSTVNGDTLTVNAGNYTENVNIDKSLTLNASGLVYIIPLNAALPVFTIDSSGNGSTIQGFFISGSTNSGIYIDGSTGNTITNNTILGNTTTSWGICLVSTTGPNNITGNNVTNCIEGINLYDANQNNITNNSVIGSVYDGIALTSSSYNNITRNNGTTLNVSGIRLITNSNNNNISNNNLTGNIWTSISLVDSQYNLINNNTASQDQEGMYLYASNNNTITGNTADNNTWDGIAIDSSNNNTIQNNLNITSNNCGIRIIGISTSNYVLNNTANGNIWADMSLDTAGDTTISGNIFNNSEEGLYLYSSDGNTITNNIMSSDIWDGIYIGNSSNNNNLTKNSINNGGYGVRIQSSTGNSIMTNNFINNYDQAYDDSNNTWNNTTTGNYYSNWNSTSPRPIDGGSSVDNHPSLTQF